MLWLRRMFNEQLENNPEQRAAVQRIVAGSSKPAPHLVFGPPGTGKTITLVEAMHQVTSDGTRLQSEDESTASNYLAIGQ